MLVLSLSCGQEIYIGDDIVIEILEVRGRNRIKIGIAAPLKVGIHRTKPEGWGEKNGKDKVLAASKNK